MAEIIYGAPFVRLGEFANDTILRKRLFWEQYPRWVIQRHRHPECGDVFQVRWPEDWHMPSAREGSR